MTDEPRCPHCKRHCELSSPHCKKGEEYAKETGYSKIQKTVKPESPDRKADESEKVEMNGKPDKHEKNGKPDKHKKHDRHDKNEKHDKFDKHDKHDEHDKHENHEEHDKHENHKEHDKHDKHENHKEYKKEHREERREEHRKEHRKERRKDHKEKGHEMKHEKDRESKMNKGINEKDAFSDSKMIIMEADEVREKLTMPVCIELMKEALIKLETKEAQQPLRSISQIPGGNLFGFMPAWLDDYFGAKVITAFHGNRGTKYPSHMGYVMMFDSKHGAPVGMADCSTITEIRTGAVSAAATSVLAKDDASKLAIIGCGAQGRSHLEAMLCVRPVKEVICYDIIQEAAEAFAKEQSMKFNINIKTAGSVEEAVKDADIICTLTPSKEPYMRVEWIKAGAHINAVGTFSPVTRELTSDLIAASKLYADQVEAMEKEAGEYIIPLQEGRITREHIIGSIGGVLSGKVPGRQNDMEITVFDALGLAVEDVICGRYLVCRKASTER